MTYACLKCIRDTHLRKKLATVSEPCEYCSSLGPCVTVFDLAMACDQVLDAHFETTHMAFAVRIFDRNPEGMSLRDTLISLNFAKPGSTLVQLIDAVAEELMDRWFDPSSGETKHAGDDRYDEPYFRLRSDLGSELSEAWRQMQDSLQHEARYINPEAIRVLNDVFGTVHQDRIAGGGSAVVKAGPRTKLKRLHRARAFQSEESLIAALEHRARLLGTPAAGIGGAGRMNSRGQPAFYGATSVEVAVAEVRPPVGAFVATAAFKVTRGLKLLDLRHLAKIQLDPKRSLFDPRSIRQAERRDFLRKLVEKLTQAVMPDHQDRDYLVTQVIADYLATHERGALDGIIYPSVQNPAGREGFQRRAISKSCPCGWCRNATYRPSEPHQLG